VIFIVQITFLQIQGISKMRYLTVNLVLEFIALSLLVTKKDSYINAENVDETCDEITMPLLSAILQGKFLDGYVFGG
jgi:hypothetical protein